MKKLAAMLIILALSAGVCFADGLNISKPDEFVNLKIGTQRGTIAEGIAKNMQKISSRHTRKLRT